MVASRFLGFAIFSSAVYGLITLENVKSLTNITWESTREITASGVILVSSDGNRQVPLLNVDNDDIEDVVAGALTHIDGILLEMVNKPMDKGLDIYNTAASCPAIVNDYHNFMSSTTHFLRAIDEKQQQFRWSAESPVFDALAWLQSLWASRNANEQQLSFIEQKLKLYLSTGCFAKSSDVLRRDVEIVEYMNDLIDSFT